MFNKILQKWKEYRSTINFSCWLKDNNGRIAFAKVSAVPSEAGFNVTSKYSRGGNSPIIQKVFMKKEVFFQFYRDFA